MKIREAIELVEKSEVVAERIIGKALGVFNLDYCDDIEARKDGKIWYRFTKTYNCNDTDYYTLEIPDEVMDDPTQERIGAFLSTRERELTIKEAKRKAAEKKVKASEEKERKKARYETYQQLKKEFSKD